MGKLSAAARHPMSIAANDRRGEIGWLGPLDITRQRWKSYMRSLVARGWFVYLGNDTFRITDAGRAALSEPKS